MHVSRPCGATGSSSQEEHSILETGTLGGQLHLCAQTHTMPGTWFIQGDGEQSQDEILVPRTVSQEGSDHSQSVAATVDLLAAKLKAGGRGPGRGAPFSVSASLCSTELVP